MIIFLTSLLLGGRIWRNRKILDMWRVITNEQAEMPTMSAMPRRLAVYLLLSEHHTHSPVQRTYITPYRGFDSCGTMPRYGLDAAEEVKDE